MLEHELTGKSRAPPEGEALVWSCESLYIVYRILYLIHRFKSFDLICISNSTELCVNDAFQKPCTLKMLGLLAIQQAE